MTSGSWVLLEVADGLDFIDVGAACYEFESIYVISNGHALVRPEDAHALSVVPALARGLFCTRPSRDPQVAGRRYQVAHGNETRRGMQPHRSNCSPTCLA